MKNNTFSSPSAPDLATTAVFTPITAESTTIAAVHLNELRSAINAVRATAGLAAASFTDPTLAGMPIKRAHMQELRDALAAARSQLALPALTFTDPILTAGATQMKAAHVTELRGGVQ
jgi:hypothetical protein